MRIAAHYLTVAAVCLANYGLVANEAAPAFDKAKETAFVNELHEKIVAASKEKAEGDMKTYSNSIPGTAASYSMVAIKSGEFLMGSPDSEKERKPDEGPQHKVKLDPFWMGQYEVTWNEYESFTFPDQTKKDTAYISEHADVLARPTKPYVEMSFGMGKEKTPAISMTQHAANKYCEWLSAKTGHFYRLPTEAEWEYACRAGTTTAYSFGDDASKLGEYAWFAENSEGPTGDLWYHKVGLKKPNPWDLYDMHGNVAEWCLDQYDPKFYAQGKDAANPWNKATKPYPHVARGGGFDEEKGTPDRLRSAARISSNKDWKQQDPQLPKSIWYMTDAKFLGFRIVRPLKVPSAEEMYTYWNSGVEKE
jgi:formylglycine-generating enzyme required for sulfatase activity